MPRIAICPATFARRAHDFFAGRRLPDVPTTALPGTPEKIEVLAQRLAAARLLWHPDDAPMDPESRELGIE